MPLAEAQVRRCAAIRTSAGAGNEQGAATSIDTLGTATLADLREAKYFSMSAGTETLFSVRTLLSTLIMISYVSYRPRNSPTHQTRTTSARRPYPRRIIKALRES